VNRLLEHAGWESCLPQESMLAGKHVTGEHAEHAEHAVVLSVVFSGNQQV
jgi:hypothetical protein